MARKLVQLQITDDDVVEKINSFGVGIERTSLPAHVTLHSIKYSVALVIINDEDEAQISASAPRTVTEGETYDYVLTVDKVVDFPFPVVISTVDMTASPRRAATTYTSPMSSSSSRTSAAWCGA